MKPVTASAQSLRCTAKALLVCMSVAAARCAEAAEPFPRFRAQKFETRLTRHVHLPYLLALPQLRNQAAAPAPARWPLLLFLHGAGERGNDLSRVLRHGPPALVQQGTNFPFILVAPQCPDGQRWDAEALMALLEDCVRRLPVDPARVYVTGLSMGGYGTWKLGLLYPERLAAIVPICGGGEWIDVRLAGREKADALRSLAVWAFHGARDNVVPLNESERMVNALKESGAQKVRFTVYPEADHDAWTITYQKAELYQWLLEQSRPTAAWPQ